MDNLEKIMSMQELLQQKYGYHVEEMTAEERSKYIQKQAQHMAHELHEMLQELPYFKEWKKYPENEQALVEMFEEAKHEWIDVLHFFINITLALGFSSSSLFGGYACKNATNYARQRNTADYKPCVEGE